MKKYGLSRPDFRVKVPKVRAEVVGRRGRRACLGSVILVLGVERVDKRRLKVLLAEPGRAEV